MHKRLSILVMLLAVGMLAFYAANRVTAASEQKKSGGDSVQDLKTRVGKLETQVAALQKQMKELALKASSRVLTIPSTRGFPGDKIPPGATEHEFNGMKYWSIPLNSGQ